MKNRFFVIFAALCGLALTGPAYTAHAQSAAASGGAVPPEKQVMLYDVYAGGIHAVKAELDVFYEKDGRYNVKLGAETIGFLGRLVPWKGTFETNGWQLGEKGDQPEVHRSVATWRGQDDLTEYLYGKDGSFKSLRIIEDSEDKSPKDIAPELVQGTTDVLTGTLEVMKHIQQDGKCEGTSEIFDGKRRFAMVFNPDMDEVLMPTDYNVYQGATTRCQVEVKPVSGEWHVKPRGWMSIQEQGRTAGGLPTVWFAKVAPDVPAVPVKVRVKTEYGTLFMHLTEYRYGDRVIKTAAIKED